MRVYIVVTAGDTESGEPDVGLIVPASILFVIAAVPPENAVVRFVFVPFVMVFVTVASETKLVMAGASTTVIVGAAGEPPPQDASAKKASKQIKRVRWCNA